MRQLKEYARRRLARRARAGSAPKETPVIGTGQRWHKPYRKSGERKEHERRLQQRRAEAWAKVGMN
jgi:hypothetical protein